jgi:ribose 5-phosphate isomerase A
LADPDELKAAAARRAVELVQPGMRLGLGSGSTASRFIAGLAGMDVTCVCTSVASAAQARDLGLRVVDDVDGLLDLAVDGADEIDSELSLIKGRGGALLREKLVALAARRFVVVADESKLVDRLGVGVLPVEVVPFLWHRTAARIADATGATYTVRGGEKSPYVTDNGNWILDLTFEGGIDDGASLASTLKNVPGVCEHGLFLDIATAAIVAGQDGVRVLGSLGQETPSVD